MAFGAKNLPELFKEVEAAITRKASAQEVAGVVIKSFLEEGLRVVLLNTPTLWNRKRQSIFSFLISHEQYDALFLIFFRFLGYPNLADELKINFLKLSKSFDPLINTTKQQMDSLRSARDESGIRPVEHKWLQLCALRDLLKLMNVFIINRSPFLFFYNFLKSYTTCGRAFSQCLLNLTNPFPGPLLAKLNEQSIFEFVVFHAYTLRPLGLLVFGRLNEWIRECDAWVQAYNARLNNQQALEQLALDFFRGEPLPEPIPVFEQPGGGAPRARNVDEDGFDLSDIEAALRASVQDSPLNDEDEDGQLEEAFRLSLELNGEAEPELPDLIEIDEVAGNSNQEETENEKEETKKEEPEPEGLYDNLTPENSLTPTATVVANLGRINENNPLQMPQNLPTGSSSGMFGEHSFP